MQKENIFFAHSGGVTSVVNAIAASVIETAKKSDKIGKVIAGKNGILGLINEELYDTYQETDEEIRLLSQTPASAFGSCRYKLDPKDKDKFKRIVEVLKAHNIRHFLYNGGNDSQDTTHKIWLMSKEMGYDLNCIGIPKTVDNDLPHTDTCPGFGSVAKYIAISTQEASLDVKAMAETSTKVFVMEVMGRHAGWIAAASGLAKNNSNDGPHIILFPEVKFDKDKFLAKVQDVVKNNGYCVVVASEGIKDSDNQFITANSNKDAFGHQQLGGVAPFLANIVNKELMLKTHWSVPDYLQRSAGHIRSATDIDQARALGSAAVKACLENKSGLMVTIKRTQDTPYKWEIGSIELEKVANIEKTLPESYISSDGFEITDNARQYLEPLISGEEHPIYQRGIPKYAQLKNKLLAVKTLTKT
jgi:6-phosphofructokinase